MGDHLSWGYRPRPQKADEQSRDFFKPRASGAPLERQVNDGMTFTDLVSFFRARFGADDGQTMAEYGVVLAVITALVVVALLALSGAIAGALNTVQGYL
jgi:Flp pilus assembly pilin Flp